MRPHHWLKNLLVLAVPLAAGSLHDPVVLVPTLAAFAAFCLASSATYLVNDVIDAPRDRLHPLKSQRPIAAGLLDARTAMAVAAGLGGAALAIGFKTSAALGWVLVAYLAATTAYSWWLKAEPIIELALLAAGFLLRAVAGGAATGLVVSMWFVLVAGFGSMFVAAGKRYSELLNPTSHTHARVVLDGYTPSFLRFAWGTTAGVTVTAYALWAVELDGYGQFAWPAASLVPFTLALLKYGQVIDAAQAEAPEDVLLSSRWLQVLALAWLLLFVLGAGHG